MEAALNFVESLSGPQKIIWIIFFMGLFWLMEGAYPLFKTRYDRLRHAKVNLILLLLTMVVNVTFGILTYQVTELTESKNFGLLSGLDLPIAANVLVGILVLDFISQYVAHYIMHKVPYLWRFHMVHHTDTKVDVTTGTRHHPGDYFFRETFALLAIFLGGIPFSIYILYRMLTIVFTYFSHANLSIPHQLDKLISYIFVSPNMHKFHHHHKRPWTDNNYGNIFSIWDRMFGTFVYSDPYRIHYGLDVVEEEKSDDIAYQITLPFNESIKVDS